MQRLLLLKRQVIFLATCFTLLGCGSRFEAINQVDLTSSFSEIDLGSNLGNAKIDGQQAYNTNCAGCHGAITGSTIKVGTFDNINSALQNQPAMQGLRNAINVDVVRAIAGAIVESAVVSNQCATAPDVGFVNIHRLNRIEYDNTLADLLGTTNKFSSELSFPPDGTANSFANNASTLVVTADLAEKFTMAAEEAITAAFANTTLKGKILDCDPAQNACVQTTLQRFLTRAFRRTVTSDEMTRYTSLVNAVKAKGETAEFSVRIALIAALSSPHFIYRITSHSQPENANATVTLGAYELASRLSYFLWSTMPDQELMNLAASGALLQTEQLTAQVRRMLASPKASAIIDNFISPWVGLGKLDRVTPDPATFPTFNETLRADLKNETRLFLADLLQRDASFFELLNAKYTFLNDRLAAHYGIPGVTGTAFQKVNLPDNTRAGILTQGSLMAIGANQYYSSIVKRGNLVLSNVLCAPPPPPPPGTPSITEAQIVNNTRREVLAAHRSNPACFSCHTQIDPIGLSFENFDALGRYKVVDEKNRPIDASGVMPTGQSFVGAPAMISILSQDARFKSCVAEKLMIYGLGRNIQAYDRCTINRIGQQAVDPSKPISAAIIEMVLSDPFRKQRGSGGI